MEEESQRIPNRRATTNEQRSGLRITVPDTVRTPVAAPTTVPVGRVDAGKRLVHVFHFVDWATPTSRKKPAGAQGCEIRIKIGDPAAVNERDL